MKAEWVKTWNRSIKARKQRKYLANAPLHIKQNLMHVHLSKELRSKYGKRAITIKKGDKVRILRGNFRKKEGKVSQVLLKRAKVYVEGIEILKKDGSKSLYPLTASNLMIIELNLDDKKRKNKLSKKENKK